MHKSTLPPDVSLNDLLKHLLNALTPQSAKAQIQQRVAVRVGVAAGLIQSNRDDKALKELEAAMSDASLIGAATVLKSVMTALENRR